jgi:2-phosphoglycerate kinase
MPFSKVLLSQSIMATGVPPERSYELAQIIERRLGSDAVDAAELRSLAEAVLQEHEGPTAAQRYRRWRRLGALDRPLVILLGGTAGTGKSTVATALAGRLAISRLTSTDMIRHILRTCFSAEVMPDVHVSSFEARRAVRAVATEDEDLDLLGFRIQAEHVGSAVRAIVQRAVDERTPLILEGVHLVPDVLPAQLAGQALVVHAILAVPDEAIHRGHFEARGGTGARAPVDRYLDELATIRKLQGHLLDLAGRGDVPVVVNTSIDEAVESVLQLVLEAVAATTP